MMFTRPKPTVESLRAKAQRLEAQGRNAAAVYAELKTLVNAQLVRELRAARLKAEKAEIAA
jgi:hypothetical protein